MPGVEKRKHVLVADDADADFFLLHRAFVNAGYSHTLVHVRSGSEAIQYLEGKGPYNDRGRYPFPDLVILDAKMPGGSGMDVLRLAGANGFSVPFVMLSGSGAPGDTDVLLNSGAVEYLRKPDEPSELLLLVQTIHHRWLS